MKTSAKTQKVGTFRIPECQKSVERQGMLPLDFKGADMGQLPISQLFFVY